MLRLRYAMASFATACADPAAILSHLNEALCRRGDATATAVTARFSPRSGELTWAQAGHPPVIVASGDRVRRLPSPDGTMLGVVPHARYDRAAARLRPGDFIVLYTDGVFSRRESVDEGINAMAGTAGPALVQADQAKLVCRSCPVRRQCLTFALRQGLDFGIWGGTNVAERRAIRRTVA
jgi:hypothetical protein